MKFKIVSKVDLLGGMKHEYIHEFPDDSNVFGRVLDYHEHMRKTFGNRKFEMISAKEIKEN